MSNAEKGNRKTESAARLRSVWAVLIQPISEMGALTRPISEMGVLREGEKGNWLRTTWTVLNRPLPGTQARSEQIWIEGRLNKFLSLAVILLAVAPLGGFLMWGSRLGIKALVEAASARLCEPGWGGYSLGGEILMAMFVSPVLVFLLISVHMFVVSWHLYKRQRNVPLGYRPWFSVRLIEGRAAVRRGVGGVIGAAAAILILILGLSMRVVPDLSKTFIVLPAKIAKCQPPHSHKAASSESLAFIPEKP